MMLVKSVSVEDSNEHRGQTGGVMSGRLALAIGATSAMSGDEASRVSAGGSVGANDMSANEKDEVEGGGCQM